MNETQLNAIVEQVVRRLSTELGKTPSMNGRTEPSEGRSPAFITKRPGIFDDLDSAGAAAQRAQAQWSATPLEVKAQVIRSMRQTTRDLASGFAN